MLACIITIYLMQDISIATKDLLIHAKLLSVQLMLIAINNKKEVFFYVNLVVFHLEFSVMKANEHLI